MTLFSIQSVACVTLVLSLAACFGGGGDGGGGGTGNIVIPLPAPSSADEVADPNADISNRASTTASASMRYALLQGQSPTSSDSM